MNNLEAIVAYLSDQSSQMRLSFETQASLKDRLSHIQQAQEQLCQYQVELASYLQKLQSAIAKIDGVRLGQAAVGLALLFFSSNDSDGDDNNFFSSLCAEISAELGNELLDRAIHTENELRDVYQALTIVNQRISLLTIQQEVLIQIAQISLTELQNQSRSTPLPPFRSVEAASEFVQEIILNLKLELTLDSLPERQKQIESIAAGIQKLEKLHSQLESIESMSQSTDSSWQVSSFPTLLSLFGSSLEGCEYDNQGQLVLWIQGQTHTIDTISTFLQQLFQLLSLFLPLAQQFRQLATDCLKKSFSQALKAQPNPRDVDGLTVEVSQGLEVLTPRFTYESPTQLQKQLEQVKLWQNRLNVIQKQLTAATSRLQFHADFPIDATVLESLIALLGTGLRGVGFNESMALVFCYEKNDRQANEELERCLQMKQLVKSSLSQSFSLSKLGEQCLKHPQILKQLESAKPAISLKELKTKLGAELQPFQRFDLNYGDVRQLRKQVKMLTKVQGKLQRYQQKLIRVLKASHQPSNLSLSPATISALFSLFGSIKELEVDDRERVVVYLKEGESLPAKQIIGGCTQLKKRLESTLDKIESWIQVAEKCLQDSALRKQLEWERRQKQLKLKVAIVAGLLILISPLAWLTKTRFEDMQAQYKARTLAIASTKVDPAPNLDALLTSHQQLKDAIGLLEGITEEPGSLYQEVQPELSQLRSRLVTIEQKVQGEKTAFDHLEAAKRLATEAMGAGQTPLTGKVDWQTVQAKWQEAVTHLNAIPEGTFVAAEAKETLMAYRAQQTSASSEADANTNLASAKKLAWEASTLLQKPLQSAEVWRQADAKWQEAVNLLRKIPDTAAVAQQAKAALPGYEKNYAIVHQRWSREQQAASNWEKAQALGTEVKQVLQSTSLPLKAFQDAQTKCQQSVSLLTAMPAGTFVTKQAQDALRPYQTSCTQVVQRSAQEQKALNTLMAAKKLATSAIDLARLASDNLFELQEALVKLSQASNTLKAVPVGTTAGGQAELLKPVLAANYDAIHQRIEAIGTCDRWEEFSCTETEQPLDLKPME